MESGLDALKVRPLLEAELGELSDEEFEFAVKHYHIDFGEQELFLDTKLDILATSVDFHRRRIQERGH